MSVQQGYQAYQGAPNYAPPSTPGSSYWTNATNSMQNFRPQAIQANAYKIMESESSSGGVKATLIIILIIVLICCCVLSWYNHFAQDGWTIGILIFLNVITVLGMGLALMYGMGKGKRDTRVAVGGGDDFFSTSYDLELTDL